MIEDSDIINSVQVPQLVKDKFLQNGILEKDLRDRPIHYSGGFAIVFVFNVDGQKWAWRFQHANALTIAKLKNIFIKAFKRRTKIQFFSRTTIYFVCDLGYVLMTYIIKNR